MTGINDDVDAVLAALPEDERAQMLDLFGTAAGVAAAYEAWQAGVILRTDGDMYGPLDAEEDR